ncbi:MAG: four helix bundle protein [Bacteroidota bacterium]
MATLKSFEELDVWKECRQLRIRISELTMKLPKQEEYRLKDQLLRASSSVTANIAEGYGRFHFQENIQFCRQARGSLSEIKDHLITAVDEGFITNNDLTEFKELVEKCTRMLNGYISYLKASKTDSK